MNNNGKPPFEPVTALIVRKVKPDRIDDFERWAGEMKQVVEDFEGYLGTDIIRPRDQRHPEYVIVVRFDEYEHLRSFMDSPERAAAIKSSEEITIGDVTIQETEGLQAFFTLPEQGMMIVPPPRFKMAILTILTLYLPLVLISSLIGFVFHGLPRSLLVLFTLLILVPLMTYILMPLVTRLFRFWLYPQSTFG